MASCGFVAETELGFEDVAAFPVFVAAADCFIAMLRAASGLSSSLSDIKLNCVCSGAADLLVTTAGTLQRLAASLNRVMLY